MLAASGAGLSGCAAEMDSGAGGFPNATAGTSSVAGASGSGGSGGGGSMTVVPPPLSACMQVILTSGVEGCATTCHAAGIGSNPLFGSLDLSGDPGPRLGGKAASNSAVDPAMKSSCRPGALLVDVANPSKSVMLERVLGTQSCGRTMPDGYPPLSDANKTCFTEWINGFRFASANEITLPPEGSGGGGS